MLTEQRAAERNHGESELALSGWFLTGSEGVLKQDDTEAYLWARRAANKGLARAELCVEHSLCALTPQRRRLLLGRGHRCSARCGRGEEMVRRGSEARLTC